MPQTIVPEIRSGSRVVGPVTLGAIGRIATARHHVAGITYVAGVTRVAIVVTVVRVVAVIGGIVITIVVAAIAVTKRATGR